MKPAPTAAELYVATKVRNNLQAAIACIAKASHAARMLEPAVVAALGLRKDFERHLAACNDQLGEHKRLLDAAVGTLPAKASEAP